MRLVEEKALPGTNERTIVYEGSAGPLELMQGILSQCKMFKSTLQKGSEVKKKPKIKKVKTEDEKPKRGKKNQEVIVSSSEEEEEEQEEESKGEESGEKPSSTPPATGSSEQVKKTKDELERDRWLSFCDRIIAICESVEAHLRKTKGNAEVDRLLGVISKSTIADSTAHTEDSKSASAKLIENAKASGSGGKSNGAGMTEVAAEDIESYQKWAKPLLFSDEADMSLATLGGSSREGYNHVFNRDILACTSAPMRRTIVISKELASLDSSLPALFHGSIFLRRDVERVDVLKACIIGPEGSPYECGCFLFDIFLPADYNQIAPKCNIVNTGGGRYRFNPNLYAEGKVCLSLLGTWSGPGWSAGQSTLLQVLVSIQSLVLSEEPILNEPGWERHAGSASSKAYTKNVRRMNVKIAMLDLLNNPPAPWKEVIDGHFYHKRKYLAKLLDKWLADDDDKPLMHDGTTVMNMYPSGTSSLAFNNTASGNAQGKLSVTVPLLKAKLESLQAP